MVGAMGKTVRGRSMPDGLSWYSQTKEPENVAPHSRLVHSEYIDRKQGVCPSEVRMRIELPQQGQTSL